jgi:hypothetical protein
MDNIEKQINEVGAEKLSKDWFNAMNNWCEILHNMPVSQVLVIPTEDFSHDLEGKPIPKKYLIVRLS